MFGQRTSNLLRLFASALISAAPLFLAASPKVPQNALPSKPAENPMQMAMPLYAPLFIENQEYSSTLTMVNEVNMHVHATVIVRRADGFALAKQVVTFAPHSQQVVHLQDLLKSEGITEAIGSVQVAPNPMEVQTMAIAAQLSIVDTRESPPAYFEEELLSPDPMQPTEYRAVAPSVSGSPSIALLNTADATQILTISCLESSGNRTRHDYTLAAAQLAFVQPCRRAIAPDAADVMQIPEGAEASDSSRAIGIDISSTTGMGTFAAWGIATVRTGGMHTRIWLNFSNASAMKSPSMTFAGVPVDIADLLGGEKFTPDLAVANFGSTPVNVTVWYSAMSDALPQVQPVARLNLPRGAVRIVKLLELRGDPGMRNSFTIASDAQPGAVISNLIARGQELYPVVQLIGKDIKVNNGGGHPWSIANGDESTLLLFNHAAKPIIFNVNITAEGITWHQLYKLAPNETHSVNIRNLIANQTPDLRGNTLSPKTKVGDASWFTTDAGNGTGRVLVSNPQIGLARNFSCGYNIVLCGSYLSTTTATFAVGTTGSLGPINGNECNAYSPTACSGNAYCTGCASDSYYWVSLNNSIAPISGPFNTPGASFHGQAGGSAQAQGQIYSSSCSFISTGTNNVQAPTSLSGPVMAPFKSYSNQTLTDCNGNVAANNFYGVSSCGSYTVLDQSVHQIMQAGLAFDENLVVTDTNSGGTASPRSGVTDNTYHLVDFYASGAIGAPLPPGSYTYVVQTITYHPTGKTVRINCIANLVSTVNITDFTTNPNPNGNCHH